MDAQELGTDELAGFLDAACEGDAELREEVEELLALDVGQSFLANSPVSLGQTGDEDSLLDGQIGRIRIDHLIARGGMGAVYAGVDDLLERPVAIKVMHQALRMSAARRSAFLLEAQVLSSLQHPNICQVHDFFEDQDRDVLVMELIEGCTLREAMKQGAITDPMSIALDVLRGLAAAHERGIVHRDLKPENIMITPQGQARILDFGLARTDLPKPPSTSDACLATDATQIAGTPGYMSPEQARGEPSTTATDLWSVGIVLTELLSGRTPWPEHASAPELIDLTRSAHLQVPRSIARAPAQLIRQLLSENAADRPTARSTLIRLQQIMQIPKKRLIMAAAAMVAVVVMGGIWKYTADLQREQSLAVAASEKAVQARDDAEDLIGFMLDELNTGLRAVGRLDLMESVSNQALAYYGQLDEARMQQTHGQPAVALMRVAEVFDGQSDMNQATAIMDRSIASLNDLHQRDPDQQMVRYRLADAQMYQTDILRTLGQFERARQISQEAIEHGRVLTRGLEPGTGPEQRPTGTERWRILLRSMYMHADTYMRVGQGQEAMRWLQQAADLAIPAVQANPALTTQLADIQFKRCDSSYDLGLDEIALDACTATLEMDRALHLESPDDYRLNRNYVLDHMTVARVHRSLGQFDQAMALVDVGARLGETLLAWEPDNATVQNEYLTLLVTRAQILHDQGQLEQSRALFVESRTMLETLIDSREDIPYLNNLFITQAYSGQINQASRTASILAGRGFSRREFREACRDFNIPIDPAESS